MLRKIKEFFSNLFSAPPPPKPIDPHAAFKQELLERLSRTTRSIDKCFWHCSDSEIPAHDDISVVRKWHVEENGWSDVGYHIFIKKNGEPQFGRSLALIPAAQYRHNTDTIAICLHGRDADKFTVEQKATAKMIADFTHIFYKGKITNHGHNEVDPNRACPVFDYVEVLDIDENGRLRNFL